MAGQLGYCGIDRQRRPLRGDEIRSCWEAAPPRIDVPASGVTFVGRRIAPPLELLDDRTPVRKLEFVEVPTGMAAQRSATAGRETGRRRERPNSHTPPGRSQAETPEAPEADDLPVVTVPAEPRWSLWGDVEG